MASEGQVSFEAFEFFEQQKELDREAHFRTARLVALMSGIYLCATTPQISLFSFAATGFLLFGVFVASIVTGQCGYWMRQILTAAVVEAVELLDLKSTAGLRWCGLLLLVTEVGIGYALT